MSRKNNSADTCVKKGKSHVNDCVTSQNTTSAKFVLFSRNATSFFCFSHYYRLTCYQKRAFTKPWVVRKLRDKFRTSYEKKNVKYCLGRTQE